jgi:hypothetical protein
MRFIVITIILFIFILSILLLVGSKKDGFSTKVMRFPGSVNVKGGLTIRTNPNKCNIKGKLCIINEAGMMECITGEQLDFLLKSNTQQQQRLKMKCVNDTCINSGHLDILKGKKEIQLKNKKDNTCYEYNNIGVHGNGGVRNDKNSWHSVHTNANNVSNGTLPNVIMKSDKCDGKQGKNFNFKQTKMPLPNKKVSQLGSPVPASNSDVHLGQSPKFKDTSLT